MSFASSISNSIKVQPLILVVIVAAIVFHISTFRSGHHWEGDFALYTAHAKNIATGEPFSKTGYIFNPERPLISPKSYPPVYPAFLAPIYKIFGVNINAFKIANLVAFLAFLLIFQQYARKRLNYSITHTAVIITVAFSPWIWLAKDKILPDFLFMAFLYGAIYLINSSYRFEKEDSQRYLLAILTGFIIYLAYGTRSLGIALIPALILLDIFRLKKIPKTTFLVIAVFGAFYLAQNIELKTDQSYLNTFESEVKSEIQETGELDSFNVSTLIVTILNRVANNIDYYHQIISSYWNSSENNAVNNAIYLLTGILASIGFIAIVLAKPSAGDSLAAVYASILVVVPFMQDRYILPLIPLYILYIFHGLEIIISHKKLAFNHATRNIFILTLLLIICISNIGTYAGFKFSHIENGVTSNHSEELFNYIRTKTPDDSVLISSKPRVVALFTERKSSIYPWPPKNREHIFNYFKNISATHIVIAKEESGIEELNEYTDWIKNNSNYFNLVFDNSSFNVYQINFAPDARSS